ncbi:hypothetical protein [Wolbachia endosymbiont of Muscidifurax uniraptor]|nr:hypothetical protein N500_0945 [Wolbachia pipientis wUni]
MSLSNSFATSLLILQPIKLTQPLSAESRKVGYSAGSAMRS